MSSEQMKILDMLSEKKISVDEATQLLDTLAKQDTGRAIRNVAPDGHLDAPSFLNWLKDIFKAFGPKEKFEEIIDRQLSGADITAMAVQTANGSIQFRGGLEDQVKIHAKKMVKAPTLAEAEAFAEQVSLETETEEGTLRIFKSHPKPPPGYDVSISYEIEGPQNLDLTLHSSNGKLETENVSGTVKAVSSNGKIRLINVTGEIEAQTSNGGIEAKLENLHSASSFKTSNGSIKVGVQQGVAPISASTSNGSIKLKLPADYAAQVDAKTLNGSVKTDFETDVTEKKHNRLIGKIGAGSDNLLKLRTSNGSIHFNKIESLAGAEV